MPYVVLDPTIDYAAHMVRFLARLGHGGIAVFTSAEQALAWNLRWRAELGHAMVAVYSGSSWPSVERLAEAIRDDWSEVSGIIPWDEGHLLYGAALGAALDLDWNGLDVISRCRDKQLMKGWLRARTSIRLNAARVVSGGRAAIELQRELGTWPVVVKPTGGSGATDVSFPKSDGELLAACQRVLDGGAGRVLLEELVGGREYVVNGQADFRSDVLVTDVWAYDRGPSHGLENVCFGAWKVDSSEPVFGHLAGYASEVVAGLGLRRAPFHLEAKVDDGGACLIEVGARFGGGKLPVLASSLHGRDLFELAACHYLAELPLRRSDVDFERYDGRAACVLLGVQQEPLAQIRRVEGASAVEALASFAGFGLLRPVGGPAPVTVDLDSRAWEVYLMHSSPAQVEHDAWVARRTLRYA